jgi:hypothetical protein
MFVLPKKSSVSLLTTNPDIMELITTTPETNTLSFNCPEEKPYTDFLKQKNKKTIDSSAKTEQELYYKESIIINYQRYKAMFNSLLTSNILVDDKFIIRDINKKAKADFEKILGKSISIGTSVINLLEESSTENFLNSLFNNSFHEIISFETIDIKNIVHKFQMEVLLFVSPSENKLLRCLSIAERA